MRSTRAVTSGARVERELRPAGPRRYAVGTAISGIAACRSFFDHMVVTDYGRSRAEAFSIWITIEECLNPPVVWERDRGWFTTAPFSEPEVFDFPEGIGPVACVNVEHEEVLPIPRWVESRRVTFKYGLGSGAGVLGAEALALRSWICSSRTDPRGVCASGFRRARPRPAGKKSRSFGRRCREPASGSVPVVKAATMGRTGPRRSTMAKYLLLKHYRGAPAAVNDVPMDRWTPEEISAHMQYMQDFADRLEKTGEFVDGQALAPEGAWVRYDGEGRPPVTDGPFAETKDLIAGWMIIDVDGYDRAVELAGELSAAPGAGGKPIHEWLEVRPFLSAPPTVTE